ncbi:MAG: GPR endopeptidase [Bacillota bacterium]
MKKIHKLEYDYLQTAYCGGKARGEPYSDLALEAAEVLAQKMRQPQPPGVENVVEQTDEGTITRVRVKDPTAGRQLDKLPGTYITFESPRLRERDRDYQENVSRLLGKELHGLLGLPGEETQKTVLVVGLGNWNATPDALGPRVVSKILVTRHLIQNLGDEAYPGLRPVCVFAPGVLGITGMETGEIVQGVVQKIKPDLVIVVDALASKSSQRVAAAIQMADTGIHPGAGIGNKRFGLTRETLGVPVFAIGVPTVVEALTIVGDALDRLAEKGRVQNPGGYKQNILQQVLQPFLGSMVVTPKEIDVLIEDLGRVVANTINIGLHPQVDPAEFLRYTQ